MTFRDFSNIKLVELFVAFLLCARFQGITAAPTVDLGVTLEDGTAAMFVRDWQALSTDFGVVGSGLDKRDGQYEKRQQASTTKPVPTPPPFPGYPSITVPPKEGILFKNARVFDGLQVRPKLDILVVGNTIQNVSQASLTAPAGARVVDLANSNRTIIPGLIDSHVHVLLNKPVATLLSASDWQLGVWAAKQLQDMLMRGFTTVRDAAGADGTIAAMVVAGDVIGPRVFPSGTIISQTSGHADFFSPYPQDDTEAVFTMTPKSNKNLLTVADGADATLQAARLNLKRKATQIKLAAGGGASSLYDPLHTTQSTPEEMQAAVRAAKNWGTYVMVHAYQTESIKMAIDNGVQQLCHGQFADEATVMLIKEKNIGWEPEAITFWVSANTDTGKSADVLAKAVSIYNQVPVVMKLIKKHGVKIGFGTDLQNSLDANKWQSKEFSLRAEYFTSTEVLQQATSNSADLLMQSGPLNTYGSFGLIKEGYLADLLVVNGDPTVNVALLENSRDNIAMIMKDGIVYKNKL